MTNNELSKINDTIHCSTVKKISEIKKNRQEHGFIEFNSYTINSLLEEFHSILTGLNGEEINKEDIELSFIDRNKFDGDICIKIPHLLQKYKGGEYVNSIMPQMVGLLRESEILKNGMISKIEAVGIYINVSFTDSYQMNSLSDVISKSEKYGENDIHKGESILVDYSSPNVAKHLHAGHIRSTIIGQVLSNLYDSNGYYTHRINHINDWGGFGFLIEGYLKWKDIIPQCENNNDMLFFIYTLYRRGEKAASGEIEFNKLSLEEKEELIKYYGDFTDFTSFKSSFQEFVKGGKIHFANLENGNSNEVLIWKQMVEWSMEDFNNFYNLLGIHQDYLIGESFYANIGSSAVKNLQNEGKVVFYSKELAEIDLQLLSKKLEAGEITEKVFKSNEEEILRDVGAYVMPLDNFERYVVLKGDESSIYATRDLGALIYRTETFSPSKIIYEVGQEQAEHFDKLFKTAKKIGINDIGFEHIYHGFYVDLKSKKKLSSRDGASNVQKLILGSIEYFKSKYDGNDSFTQTEINDIAYKLAIGSIIFNDIRSDKKNPVSISSDINESCLSFEESGGAYIIYSIVRANSILTKIGNTDDVNISSIGPVKLDNVEKQIINEIMKYPLIIKQASEQNNPAILTEFLSNLSRFYNSYYNSHRVIDGESVIKHRIIITKSIIQILKNALKICGIQVPARM